MRKLLLLWMSLLPALFPATTWSQVTQFPYLQQFEQAFDLENDEFLPNWFGNEVDGTRIFQEDQFAKSETYALGLWPVVEEGQDEEEVEIFADVHLDLTGMDNVATRFWMATRATGAEKHVKLFMQTSIDGGLTFSSRVPMSIDHRGFMNVDSDYNELVYALHPGTFNQNNVVLRFVAKAGARKGTAAKILIDDVHVFEAESDIFPPIALEPKPLSTNEIQIGFSEPVGENALDISNYSLNSIPLEGEVIISSEGDVVRLILASPILIGKYYELGIANVKDLAGNVMTPITSEIIYNPLREGLVITEIMYDEPPKEQNDDLEFLELFNATSEPIELGGLRIKGGITSGRLPEYTLEPGSYWITAKNAAAFTNFFGMDAYEWHGANLSNDEPETIYIINTDHHSDVRIDQVTYSTTSPWPEGAAGGGYSLVLCDASLDNDLPSNWSQPTQYAGNYKGYDIYASPGKGCCTSEIVVDAGHDKIVYIAKPEKFQCTQLSATVSGGTPPYTYSWDTPEDLSAPEVEVCPTISTTYTITVTDANGCTGTDEVIVLVSSRTDKQKIDLCFNGISLSVPSASVKGLLELGACADISGAGIVGEELVKMVIYPNPSTGPVALSFTSLVTAEAVVEVYNSSGQIMSSLPLGFVLGGQEYQYDLDTSNWPVGSYFILLKIAGATFSQQLVIN